MSILDYVFVILGKMVGHAYRNAINYFAVGLALAGSYTYAIGMDPIYLTIHIVLLLTLLIIKKDGVQRSGSG